ncbi:MAG: hypothetical protein E5X67_25070 [Mesorhizobium sp.]|nr:MAG: hypothetical protein E5X67_25070 [Mesorhizobium sp.]
MLPAPAFALPLTTNVAEKVPRPKLPISPLVGEMPGRAEGGAKERQPRSSATSRDHAQRCALRLIERPEGQRPPLSCRTSPPQGGRSRSPTAAPTLRSPRRCRAAPAGPARPRGPAGGGSAGPPSASG